MFELPGEFPGLVEVRRLRAVAGKYKQLLSLDAILSVKLAKKRSGTDHTSNTNGLRVRARPRRTKEFITV